MRGLLKKAASGVPCLRRASFAEGLRRLKAASRLRAGALRRASAQQVAIFPCSRITHTFRASKWLRPSLRGALGRVWTNPSGRLRACFFEPTRSLFDGSPHPGQICMGTSSLFNTPMSPFEKCVTARTIFLRSLLTMGSWGDGVFQGWQDACRDWGARLSVWMMISG